MNKRFLSAFLTLTFLCGLSACSLKPPGTAVSRQETTHQEKLQTDDADDSAPEDEASAERIIDHVETPEVEINLGDPVRLPERVHVVYNEHSLNGLEDVTWDESQIRSINTDKAGSCTVNGTLKDGTPVSCLVTTAKKNWLRNPGFEQNDISMWKVSYQGNTNPTRIQTGFPAAKSGANSFYFESSTTQNFHISQTVSDLETGTYTAAVCIRTENIRPDDKIYLYASAGGRTIRSDLLEPEQDLVWQTLKISGIPLGQGGDITIGIKVKCSAKGRGTIDDFSLVLGKKN